MWRAMLAGVALSAGCLPTDPPNFRRDAGASPAAKTKRAPSRPSAPRPPAPRDRAPAPAQDPLVAAVFEDDFERPELGAAWRATSQVWSIEEGRLCGERARNHPVWLARRLPRNARIEFTATSGSPDGDIKVEAWGDGKSAAKGTSYDDATSYIAILGGWRNSLHVLARLEEHGSDRLETRLAPGGDDIRTAKVVEGKSYRLKLERADGHTVSFSVDDTLIHSLDDPSPLFGDGHDHFGFNDWDVPVCFDDVVVTPLEE